MASSRLFFASLACLLVISMPLSGQYSLFHRMKYVKGYVIYNSGDSVRGFIGRPDRNSKASVLNFKKGDREQAPVKINPIDIKRFGFGQFTNIYVSEEVPLQDARTLGFVKRLMDGPYPVYYYEFLHNQHILIKAPDGKLYDLLYPPDYDIPLYLPAGEDKFSHGLKTIFAGNDVLLSGIHTIKPDKTGVVNYLSKYYERNQVPYTISGLPIFRFRYELLAGFNITWLKWIPPVGLNLTAATPGPYAGVNLCFYDKVTGIGVLAEDIVSYDSFHYSYTFGDAGISTEYRESFIKTFSNEARLGISWNHDPKTGLRGFLEAGGSYIAFINPSFDNYEQSLDIDTRVVRSSHNFNTLFSSDYFGGFLRSGINFKTGKNIMRASLGLSFLVGSQEERLISVTAGLHYQFKSKR